MNSLLVVARDALERVQDEPARTQETAESLLADVELDATTRVVARWALGRALHEQDAVAAAVVELEGALEEASNAGMTAEVGEIGVSLSICLFYQGLTDEAFSQLDRAEEQLEGGPWGRAVMQRALLEHRRGAHHTALELFDHALPVLVEALDDIAEARLLANRSALHTYLGHWSEAESDLNRLLVLADRLGQRMMHAVAYQNLAFLLGRRGELPRAFAEFAHSREALAQVGNPARLLASLDLDEAELMMTAGLFDDAVRLATEAVEQNLASGNSIGEGDARLLLSQALLQAGKPAQAAREARKAGVTLARDKRDAWTALARFVAMRAELVRAAIDRERIEETTTDDANALIELLESHGWLVEALQVRVEVAQAIVRSAGGGDVTALLRGAPDLRQSGSFVGQLMSWRLEAIRRFVEGNERSASRALGAGLRLVERYRATLGATELRAHASAHGTALASLGLERAAQRRRAREVLLWSERLRAVALVAQPTALPEDDEIELLLADLRHAQALARDEISEGSDPWQANERLRSAEANVTEASRRSGRRGGVAEYLTAAVLNRLIDSLGDRLLIEFVRIGSETVSITVDRGVVRLRPLGPTADLERRLDRMLFATRRTISGRAPQHEHEATAELLSQVAIGMDALLLGPRDRVHGRDVIVVPTGRLHEMPWGGLPRLHNSPTTVVPSLRLWAERGRRSARTSEPTIGIVAGPGLPGAQLEADRLAATLDSPIVLDGADATAERVRAMFETTDLLHVTAHGTFRNESPMFSELHLHDGSLTVHDIERLASVPRTVVLPACDAGRHHTAAGDELLGTVGTLLSLGVDAVVAPVMAIPDESTTDLMYTFHQHLASGARPAEALAHVRASTADLEPSAQASAWSFSSFGVRDRVG